LRLLCLTAVLAGVPVAAAAQEALSLSLICAGQLTQLEQTRQTSTITDDKDYTKSATVETKGFRTVVEARDMSVVIEGGSAKLKPPWQPTFKSRPDGWYPVDNFVATEDEFTGSAKVGLLSTRLRIDRRTGAVRFGDDYRGMCDKGPPPGARKF
jgi:hypothetical protein